MQNIVFYLVFFIFFSSPVFANFTNNSTLNFYTEQGIIHYFDNNFDAALQDFDHAIANSHFLSDELLAAYLMRCLTHKQLGNGKSSSNDLCYLQACDTQLSTHFQFISDKNFSECQRNCEIAESAAYALCGSLTLKGVKGALGAAACAAMVKILAQQCEDCCLEGFGNCAKKIETFTKDLIDATFPADPSILD